MKYLKIVCSNLWIFSILTLSAGAEQARNSDWLNTVAGSRDYVMGAEVLNVLHNDSVTIVEVGFPEGALKHFHSAFVESRLPRKIIAYTTAKDLMKDQKNKPYGIRFKFKQLPGFEFRVNLYEKLETSKIIVASDMIQGN